MKTLSMLLAVVVGQPIGSEADAIAALTKLKAKFTIDEKSPSRPIIAVNL